MRELVKQIANENGGLALSEAVIFCLQHKYNITPQGLVYIGEKEGWIRTIRGHKIVDLYGLQNHVYEINEPIPNGWIKISSMRFLCKTKYKFYNTINKAINANELVIRIYGRERIRYGEEKRIRRLFECNRERDLKQKIKGCLRD